jgi:hypothetical protein
MQQFGIAPGSIPQQTPAPSSPSSTHS